ncbi:TPA: UbiA family prenyltransferase [Candidatus Micrarchaeota archaeon]|nr:UbiA family prenyltransferase [Candidatus Micrarchaeota archaeon]
MKKILAYKRLFRIEHALMLAAAVLFSELLTADAFDIPLPTIEIILLSLAVPLFIEMGSFALNDYWDVKSDRENRRLDRPIVTGDIKPKNALAASAICYIIGVGAAVPLPANALFIAVFFALFSMLYNLLLKDVALLGNAYIASSMAIPFVFGNIIVSDMSFLPLLAIADVAFIAGLGREIIKTVEDVEGDVKHRKSSTLPALVGKANAIFGAQVCYALLVPLSFLPYFFGLPMNTLSLGAVTLTALAFAFMAVEVSKKPTQKTFESARKTSLLALAIGLLGYAASLI